MSKLSKNRYVHHSTQCCIFSSSGASVIVGDTCLADSAISASADSTTSRSGILTAAVRATVIPPGRWMEILPVTQIQASASAKQTLLVCNAEVCSHISVTVWNKILYLISLLKSKANFLAQGRLGEKKKNNLDEINCLKMTKLIILSNYSLKLSLINPLEVSLFRRCSSSHGPILISHRKI